MKIKCLLNEVPFDKEAVIIRTNADGSIGRRLFDVGFSEGATVIPEFSDLKSSITAYKVPGGVIALRDDLARKITTEYEV